LIMTQAANHHLEPDEMLVNDGAPQPRRRKRSMAIVVAFGVVVLIGLSVIIVAVVGSSQDAGVAPLSSSPGDTEINDTSTSDVTDPGTSATETGNDVDNSQSVPATTNTPTTAPSVPVTENPTNTLTLEPTREPSATPTIGNVDPPDTGVVIAPDLLLCDASIQCMTDRWENSLPLASGQSMCNDEWRFGVVRLELGKGALVWQDCVTTETLFLQNVTNIPTTNNDDLAFQMTVHGVFQILGGSSAKNDWTPLWELESIYTPDIQLFERCLNNNPIMNCPYLHLRKRGGNIVLNYISSSGWQARKVHKSYPDLFPPDFE